MMTEIQKGFLLHERMEFVLVNKKTKYFALHIDRWGEINRQKIVLRIKWIKCTKIKDT